MSSDLFVLVLGIAALAVVVYLNRRGPRPPRPPRAGGAGRPLIAALLTLSLLGCGNAIVATQLIVGSAADLYNLEEPRLEAAEKAKLDACLHETVPPADRPACVDKVIDAWAPVKEALVGLDGAIHAARLGLLVARARDAAGIVADVGEIERLAVAVLNAVVELQRLTAPKAVLPLLPARVLPLASPPSTATPSPRTPAAPAIGGAP